MSQSNASKGGKGKGKSSESQYRDDEDIEILDSDGNHSESKAKVEISSSDNTRLSRACARCRFRHTRCPGGQPCMKCQMAKTKCEYEVFEKRLIVSRKYLYKIQEDLAKLKRENASLRNSLKEEQMRNAHEPNNNQNRIDIVQQNEQRGQSGKSSYTSILPESNQDVFSSEGLDSNSEVIHPSLDKYGRMVQSRNGGKVYVGSSSMTLFGLEIQKMAPAYPSTTAARDASSSYATPLDSSKLSYNGLESGFEGKKRESRILEKEGNAYNITLTKSNTRPGLSVNFTLPSYSYAILLVDTFINYNDGCFYFFNEGLVKKFLMNLYAGNNADNKKIIKRNVSPKASLSDEENPIKKDTDDDTILETIWFCKILLIFAVGEVYLGADSETHLKNSKQEAMHKYAKNKTGKTKNRSESQRNTLPGSNFFYQASDVFTGLFASGAIDNFTMDGGIEVTLLYAFYLQVADCTISSYFYFGLALRSALILGWHVDADMENLNRFELEHRRRIWWTVYMYERMLSSKAGLPLSFADDSVSTELPFDFKINLNDSSKDENDIRSYYIFPSAEFINNCVTITRINAAILSLLYTKQPTANILPVVSDLVQRLFKWKSSLPEFLRVDFSKPDVTVSRLVVNLMTEYFQGMNLAVRPLLFHFATKKLKETQSINNKNSFIDLSNYSKTVVALLNASFQASINTIKCIWSLLPQGMVALFGWMDREYLFTAASTLILFNASFGVHDATRDHLDHTLVLFTKMKKLGNFPAAHRRAQLIKLIKILDFNGVMNGLLSKHDDEYDPFSESSTEHDGNYNNIPSESTSNPASSHYRHLSSAPEVYSHNLEQIQYIEPVPTSSIMSNHQTSHVVLPDNHVTEEAMSIDFGSKIGDQIFPQSDLAGIEGVTFSDEDQNMWNEITNDAGWLQPTGAAATNSKPEDIPEDVLYAYKYPTKDNNFNQSYSMSNLVGAYSNIMNDFHENDS